MNYRPWPRRTGAWLAALLLAGCNAGPDFTPPPAPAQTAYDSTGAPKLAPVAGESAQSLAIGQKISGDWWNLYHSPALDGLLKDAIAGNKDLEAARAHLAASEEAANAARGGLYPRLDADGLGDARAHQLRRLRLGSCRRPPSTCFRSGRR